MNELSSTTPATVAESTVLDLVRQAAQRGRERIEAARESNARERDAEAAANVEYWADTYKTLGLDDWMLPFIEQPDPYQRPDDCLSLRLELPTCAPIVFVRAHSAHSWRAAQCHVRQPFAVNYDDDSGEWFADGRLGMAYPLILLDMAIAEAEQHGPAWAELQLESTRRTERGAFPAPWTPAPAPAPVEIAMPDDPAAKVLAHIAELNPTTDDLGTGLRGVLYGFITLAKELRGLRVELAATRAEIAATRAAVEDIAAAALCDELAEPETDNVY